MSKCLSPCFFVCLFVIFIQFFIIEILFRAKIIKKNYTNFAIWHPKMSTTNKLLLCTAAAAAARPLQEVTRLWDTVESTCDDVDDDCGNVGHHNVTHLTEPTSSNPIKFTSHHHYHRSSSNILTVTLVTVTIIIISSVVAIGHAEKVNISPTQQMHLTIHFAGLFGDV